MSSGTGKKYLLLYLYVNNRSQYVFSSVTMVQVTICLKHSTPSSNKFRTLALNFILIVDSTGGKMPGISVDFVIGDDSIVPSSSAVLQHPRCPPCATQTVSHPPHSTEIHFPAVNTCRNSSVQKWNKFPCCLF